MYDLVAHESRLTTCRIKPKCSVELVGSFTDANTDRLNGWAELMTRFGDVDAGIRPTLFVHERCGRLTETLPTLQHDPNRPEDVLKVDADEDGVGGDDCADCLRYLVATKPREIIVRKLRGL